MLHPSSLQTGIKGMAEYNYLHNVHQLNILPFEICVCTSYRSNLSLGSDGKTHDKIICWRIATGH
jgi:hypothetical protein